MCPCFLGQVFSPLFPQFHVRLQLDESNIQLNSEIRLSHPKFLVTKEDSGHWRNPDTDSHYENIMNNKRGNCKTEQPSFWNVCKVSMYLWDSHFYNTFGHTLFFRIRENGKVLRVPSGVTSGVLRGCVTLEPKGLDSLCFCDFEMVSWSMSAARQSLLEEWDTHLLRMKETHSEILLPLRMSEAASTGGLI